MMLARGRQAASRAAPSLSRSAAARSAAVTGAVRAASTAASSANASNLGVLLAASITAAGVGGVAVSTCAPVQLKERATGVYFDGASPFDNTPLAGTGCRYKFGFVKIYALGLYCDTAAAGASAADGEKVWAKLMDDGVAKTVSLKMVYTLKPQQLIDALNDSFKPRLALPGRSSEGMQSFEEAMIQLAEGTCEAGDEYHFIYTPDGGFTVSAKKKGSDALTAPIKVDNADIQFAIFDTYLGANGIDAVSPSMKDDVLKHL